MADGGAAEDPPGSGRRRHNGLISRLLEDKYARVWPALGPPVQTASDGS